MNGSVFLETNIGRPPDCVKMTAALEQVYRKAGEGFSPGAIRAVLGIAEKPQPPVPLLHGVFKQRMEKGVTFFATWL